MADLSQVDNFGTKNLPLHLRNFQTLTNKIKIILQKVIKKLGSFIFVLYLCNQKQGTNTTIYKKF